MSNPRPFVTITEQPAAKLQRFRYLSEVDGARSVGSIPGVNSLPDRKTYPTIRVHGHKGPFLVLLSLLNPTDNLVHPHAITGSDPRYQCRQGVIYVITEGPDVVFKNIGILCVKGKTETDVKTALKSRQRMNIDPFKAGFQHIGDHRLIDFTAVRLCFQVFLPGPEWSPADLNDLQKYTWPLPPVASDVVYDAKKLNDLKITYINGCAGPLTGGHEMTLLCEKYTGQNPDVVFDDEHGWTETASVELYHKQLAIVFKTPRYPYREDRDPNCADGYKVKVYLQQSTERGIQRSQPATLQYLPNDPEGNSPKFPIAPQPEKPNISLKQVRIQQRPCPGNSNLKRWRPWGRSDVPPDLAAAHSDEDHFHSQNDDLDKIVLKKNDDDGRTDAVPLFDPETSEFYTHEWLGKIDQLGAINNWSDTVKSYYMQTRLAGSAKDWLSKLHDTDDLKWPDWKERILEAFPRNPQKVDYVELLQDMLAKRKIISERAQYYYNKHALRARHEMNAKKAYACLIEGVPLQMKPPAHYEHHEAPGYLHPEYHIDIEDSPFKTRQEEPLNMHIASKFGTTVQEDKKIINFNEADYPFETNCLEDRRDYNRVCCHCKEEPRVIRRCSSNRQNETRPSCIQRNLRRPALEKSWHKPCSTLTSRSSSPSLSNPAPDWPTDQASYLPNKLSKMRRKGAKPESSNPFTTPNTPSNMQPISPYQNIKQSPSSYQVTSPVNNAESDYSVNFDGEFGDTQHSSIQQMSSVLHQNSITPNMNLAPRSTLNMNTNPTMNTPPTITALHHAHQGSRFNANNNRVHRFTARIPSGTQIKRPKPEQNLSGELLPKRDKLMSPGFEHPQPTPSTLFNINNKFNIINEPVPFNDPVTDTYLPTKGGNIVNQNDPGLSNLPPDYSNIDESKNMSEYLDSIWSHMQENERNKTIHSIIQEAESWMLALPNLNNHLYSHNRNVNQNVHNVDQNDMFNIYQNIMPNVDQNIANHQIDARDEEEESVSEELRRMIL